MTGDNHDESALCVQLNEQVVRETDRTSKGMDVKMRKMSDDSNFYFEPFFFAE